MQRQVEASPVQIENCHEPGWRQQFGHPRGLLGRLAGHLMAVKNAEMHQLTVDQLELGEDDCVLEIGFGHGRMIRMMAECAPQGLTRTAAPSRRPASARRRSTGWSRRPGLRVSANRSARCTSCREPWRW